MSSNVIELNGKKYDALTGALLDVVAQPSHSTYVKQLAVHPRPGHGSVDGMVGSQASKHHAHAAKKAPAGAHKAISVAHHQPERSKTLMRHAVKPPAIKQKTATKTLAPMHKTLPAKLAVKPKLSSDVIDPSRNKRAQVANRSQMVQRFNSAAPAGISQNQPQHHATPAQPAAKTPPVIHHQAQTHAQPRPRHGGALDIRRPAAAARPAAPHRQTSQQQGKALFENALAHASSHEQPRPHESGAQKVRRGAKKRSKLLSLSAAAAIFLLLAGFVAYQSRASIQLELASAKAGFNVSTPLYKPNGFSLGKLSYSPGTATLAYTNSSSNQSFSLTQKESNWDSQTLLDNYVATAGKGYQGFQSNGRTVYVYGDGSDATWVNGGIWYQIHTDSKLEADQLVKIAASM